MSDERNRPAALWVVGIFAIVLGVLGSCGGTFGIGTLFFQDSMLEAQQDMLDSAGQTSEQREQQLELQRRTVEVARKYRAATIGAQVLNLIASFGLLIGAVLLFRWSPATFVVLAAACAGSALADVLVGLFGVLVQQETMAVMTEAMASTGDAQADRMAQGIFRASGTFGICFAVGWLVAKLAFYAGAIFALRTPETKRLFNS